MIGIRSIQVNSYDLSSLTVEWDYETQPPGVNLATTTVDIQKSESDNFSTFETIAAGLNANNNNSYTDNTLSGVITHRYKDMNYRLRFVEQGGKETLSNIVWLTYPINLNAKDIIRRKGRILSLRGLPCNYLKKKNYGQTCPDCYDEVMDMQTEGNCLTCYNTRFVGGYYNAIKVSAFLTQSPDQNLINKFGEFNPGQLMFSISSYPRLNVNDVIVDHLNRRWYVTRVNNVSYQGFIISQDAVLSLIDHNDVIYEIDIT